MTIQDLLKFWQSDPEIKPNIVAWQTIPALPADLSPFPDSMPRPLQGALTSSGIGSLYAHQADSWQYAAEGDNLVVVTGTASGKTLCYNLPILDRLLRVPDTRALYLFPTKALAQDQENKLKSLYQKIPELKKHPVATYDGDTPSSARKKIRDQAQLIITNPDMLHVGILPHHPKWASFFRALSYVVIDEIHTYRGVFGSHVANVIRRLSRIAAFYNAEPQFILTSATIANPVELADRLIEKPVRLIDRDGAARGARHFLIYNPPIVNEELGIRSGALLESVRLTDDLLTYRTQTILFARTRRAVEITLTYLRQGGRIPPEQIRGYRSGYLPRERRQIEKDLRDGEIKAVVATNALELGIDIGSLGAAVLAGYPGSIAATWQQAGRAGRDESEVMALLITSANPLDQFLAAHPEYFFGRSPENALINPDNILILLAHIRAAAFELPFRVDESFGRLPPDQLQAFLEVLAASEEVHLSQDRYFWMADQYPAHHISLRSASAARVLLQVLYEGSPTIIGEVDLESAPWMVHPGAIYLHEGQLYEVEDLDIEKNLALLQRTAVDFYTQSQMDTTVTLVEEYVRSEVIAGEKRYGEISVISQVIGYQKIQWDTHERLDVLPLDMPPSELLTTGYWLIIGEDTVAGLREAGLWSNDPNDYGPNWEAQRRRTRARDSYQCRNCGIPEDSRSHDVHHKVPFRSFASYEQANRLSNLVTLCPACHRKAETVVRVRSGLSGLSYTLRHLAPLFLMCDSGDLGVHSDPQSPLGDGQPVVVIFDRAPAGIGLSQRLFELHSEIMTRAYELVISCGCEEGCPSCVGPPGEIGFGGKRETIALLKSLSKKES